VKERLAAALAAVRQPVLQETEQRVTDSVVDRIRAARHTISGQCGHDAERLVAYYLKRQQGLADRLSISQQEIVRDKKA